ACCTARLVARESRPGDRIPGAPRRAARASPPHHTAEPTPTGPERGPSRRRTRARRGSGCRPAGLATESRAVGGRGMRRGFLWAMLVLFLIVATSLGLAYFIATCGEPYDRVEVSATHIPKDTSFVCVACESGGVLHALRWSRPALFGRTLRTH